ncbi:ATP-dependent DNA helicase 2 subunit ku70-like protein [Trifolium pratense]|uniref:ATP-dependent DNA helicase 2 subunit ku70-like protein n=1 Tax=Trifolium pratense TaxID=57577 RepID=A0A2K3PHE4_TRIPR|nr:ATP-dependent DNA helicase 2 subunit ku70-like protein [Trifolium pratense]
MIPNIDHSINLYLVAFSGSSSRPQMVALIAQVYLLILKFSSAHFTLRPVVAASPLDEVIQSGVQIEPPGMHMIYLPYSDDIRLIEERYSDTSGAVTKASDDQIKKAADLIKRVDLKDFSVFQFSNPVNYPHIHCIMSSS